MKLYNGWTLLTHEVFESQLDRLTGAVIQAQKTFHKAWRKRAAPRCMAAVQTLMFYQVPRNPVAASNRPNLLPGTTGWFREVFADGRFALYYRVNVERRTILYAWLADRSHRKEPAGANTPCVVFNDISLVTDTGRVVVPHRIRQALDLELGGQLLWRIDEQSPALEVSNGRQQPRASISIPAPAPAGPLGFNPAEAQRIVPSSSGRSVARAVARSTNRAAGAPLS